MKQPFSVLTAILQKKLEPLYPKQTARRNAILLLEKLLDAKQEELITQKELSITEEQEELLEQWIDHLVTNRMPLQYILGSTDFLGLEILVTPPTLIPRPETEYWVSLFLENLQKNISLKIAKLDILDLCSGSGCIGLALAKNLPNSSVIALDIEQQAIELGIKNAHHNGITNIKFLQSDLFDAIGQRKFDLIVANPPYISHQEWQTLEPEVKDWEDPRALIANDDGYTLIKKIIEHAPEHLTTVHGWGQLWIEIGWQQSKTAYNYFQTSGFHTIETIKDLSHTDRTITGSIKTKSL